MTLRKLIKNVLANEPEKIYAYLFARDRRSMAGKVTPERTVKAYGKVLNELSEKPRTRAFAFPIIVTQGRHPEDSEPDVSLLNPKWVRPPKGMRPWGGRRTPKGYYNANLPKYSRYYAFGYTAWSKLIDTPIINRAKLKKYELLGLILGEMTFYGWTEAECEGFLVGLKGELRKAKEEIARGEAVRIPRKSKKGYDIVIPNSVMEQIGHRPKKTRAGQQGSIEGMGGTRNK
jgi:hypothetical protein